MAKESKQFWGNMQSGYKTCEVKLMLKIRRTDITTGTFKKILGRMPNWKSPGPDLVQGFD